MQPRLLHPGGNHCDLAFHQFPCLWSTLHTAARAICRKGRSDHCYYSAQNLQQPPTPPDAQETSPFPHCPQHPKDSGPKLPPAPFPMVAPLWSHWPARGRSNSPGMPLPPQPLVPSANLGILPPCLYSKAFSVRPSSSPYFTAPRQHFQGPPFHPRPHHLSFHCRYHQD